MEALGDLLTSFLSDPEKLSQITSVAESLGLSPSAPEKPVPPSGAFENAELLSAFLKQAERPDPHQTELLCSLRPFLRPERRPALDRAVRAARLSSLAALALRTLQDETEPKEF